MLVLGSRRIRSPPLVDREYLAVLGGAQDDIIGGIRLLEALLVQLGQPSGDSEKSASSQFVQQQPVSLCLLGVLELEMSLKSELHVLLRRKN